MSSSYYSTQATPFTPSYAPSSAYTPTSTYNPATYTTASSYPSYPNYSMYSSQTSTSTYQSYYSQTTHALQHTRASPPPYEPPPPPDYSSVNQKVAAESVHRLISAQLRKAGFDGTESGAVNRLEREAIGFVLRLYKHAHEMANLANRSGPIVTDLMLACKAEGLEVDQLKKAGIVKRVKKRKTNPDEVQSATLVLPDPPEPLPDLLPSDDETQPSLVVPVTLRAIPHFAPTLPPKHTYLRTPVSPLKKAALPSLQKKLKNAALVQESLKNLMLATEDNPDDEDGELLGAIVNGQAIGYQRKRWKLSA